MKVALTDRFVAGAKADSTGRSDYFDAVARGLSLRVTANGVKTWCFNCTRDGKRARFTIGSYPAASLAEARRLAVEARGALEEGRDPGDMLAARKAGAMTVQDLFAAYLSEHVQTNLRTAVETERRMRKNILPVIGSLPLADLHRRDINRVLQPVLQRDAPIEATLVFANMRAMLRWGVRAGYLDRSPAEGLSRPATAKIGERVLSDEEIASLWNNPLLASSVTKHRIIKLCLITGQRIGEIAGMRRAELDWDTCTWTLPGTRTKNKHTHVVPLTDPAVSIIRDALKEGGDSAFVFGIDPPSPPAMARHISRHNYFGLAHWSLHDLRRTALSKMASLGVAPIVIGHIANHVSVTKAGVTFAVYVKHTYDSEKRQALTLWADRLLAIAEGRDQPEIGLRANG
jgi:integrase